MNYVALRILFKEMNTEKLTAFINTLNGKEGTGSHLVTVPPGPSLADALLSSPILAGEGGSMMGLGASDFEFGVDPSADPELALVSNMKSASEMPTRPCFGTTFTYICQHQRRLCIKDSVIFSVKSFTQVNDIYRVSKILRAEKYSL